MVFGRQFRRKFDLRRANTFSKLDVRKFERKLDFFGTKCKLLNYLEMHIQKRYVAKLYILKWFLIFAI